MHPKLRKIRAARGCSSMAERQLPKLHTRVRFPSPAPNTPSKGVQASNKPSDCAIKSFVLKARRAQRRRGALGRRRDVSHNDSRRDPCVARQIPLSRPCKGTRRAHLLDWGVPGRRSALRRRARNATKSGQNCARAGTRCKCANSTRSAAVVKKISSRGVFETVSKIYEHVRSIFRRALAPRAVSFLPRLVPITSSPSHWEKPTGRRLRSEASTRRIAGARPCQRSPGTTALSVMSWRLRLTISTTMTWCEHTIAERGCSNESS